VLPARADPNGGLDRASAVRLRMHLPVQGADMARSKLGEAADAARTIAGAALGAAAIAATGVVVSRVAGAIQKGGKQLAEATPTLQNIAAQTVTKPLLPKRSKRTAKRKSRTAKAKKAATGSRTKRRAAKRAPAKTRSRR